MNAIAVAQLRDHVARARLGLQLVQIEQPAGKVVVCRTRCVYCGGRLARSSQLACREHDDLVELDPKFARRSAA